MAHFLGLDSSTQSLSAMIIDTVSKDVVYEASLNFGKDMAEFNCPQGFLENSNPLVKHSNPLMWVEALDRLFTKMKMEGVNLSEIQAISGSGQQHGTVYLSESLNTITPDPSGKLADAIKPILSRTTSPIWMDSSTTAECREISEAVGDANTVQKKSGSPAIERFSGPQIRKFYKDEPETYANTKVIHLVSSFLASVLAGKDAGIDFGDGAGMNLLNLQSCQWDQELADATAPDLIAKLPQAVASRTVEGTIADFFVEKYGFSSDCRIISWSGDNPNSLVGAGGSRPGAAIISLGTSDTFFAAMHNPCVDPDGCGHVFGNPAGGFMSLICFKNGSLAREKVKDETGVSWQEFDTEAFEQTSPGNNGNLMLPYFVPEITPLVLEASPVYKGTTEFKEGKDSCGRIRAVVEAQAMSLRLHSLWIGEETDTLRLTGGASKSDGICRVMADVFNARVERLEVGNSACLGAAMRAAEAGNDLTWDELTEAFCKADTSKTIKPIPENVSIYKELLPAFKKLVHKVKS